jgi:hypothetical protein
MNRYPVRFTPEAEADLLRLFDMLIEQNPSLAERAGYVALFEIDDPQTATILAVRDQREDDYH